MRKLTHLVISSSNILGLIPVYSLFAAERYYGSALVFSAVVASVFMHLTETKHDLQGLYLAEYSNTALWIDRIVAYLTGLYGLYLFYINPVKSIWMIICPLYGAFWGFIGERTRSLPWYMFAHTTWHFFAYLSLHSVV